MSLSSEAEEVEMSTNHARTRNLTNTSIACCLFASLASKSIADSNVLDAFSIERLDEDVHRPRSQ